MPLSCNTGQCSSLIHTIFVCAAVVITMHYIQQGQERNSPLSRSSRRSLLDKQVSTAPFM